MYRPERHELSTRLVTESTRLCAQAACIVALLEAARCAARGPLARDDAAALLAGLRSESEVRARHRAATDA